MSLSPQNTSIALVYTDPQPKKHSVRFKCRTLTETGGRYGDIYVPNEVLTQLGWKGHDIVLSYTLQLLPPTGGR